MNFLAEELWFLAACQYLPFTILQNGSAHINAGPQFQIDRHLQIKFSTVTHQFRLRFTYRLWEEIIFKERHFIRLRLISNLKYSPSVHYLCMLKVTSQLISFYLVLLMSSINRMEAKRT